MFLHNSHHGLAHLTTQNEPEDHCYLPLNVLLKRDRNWKISIITPFFDQRLKRLNTVFHSPN